MIVGFIGAGKMGEALIAGMISKKVFPEDRIIACAPSEETRVRVGNTYGIKTCETAEEMSRHADVLVLAVKPKHVPDVFAQKLEIKGKVLISVVAGLSLERLEKLAPGAKAVRVMPNHCCMVLEGAMGYACSPGLGCDDKKEVERMLSATGLAVEVPESEMDAITGIAGSSPAFMYMIIDAMADAGVLNGLSRKDSIRLAAQSMLGAAKMVLETGKHPDQLKDEVCSPGGTTIEGVRALEDMGLRSAMIAAVDGAVEKSRMMSGRRSPSEKRLQQRHPYAGGVAPYGPGLPVQVLLVADGG
ncbi:MAG: pyrroline-5-carboxylate reductase, partial [Candidatus Methanomethylophilaceae archaeon]|nr:pyrroline-5-carboxylate reductase [Candidatus Methanomethylophilaceae archaeon]